MSLKRAPAINSEPLTSGAATGSKIWRLCRYSVTCQVQPAFTVAMWGMRAANRIGNADPW